MLASLLKLRSADTVGAGIIGKILIAISKLSYIRGVIDINE